MKFIITAKNIRNGKEHITDPLERTEICTEMIITRLKTIEMLNTGKINKSDTIVTRIDRKCLYENLFENIIDWNDFSPTKNDSVIDLASRIYELDRSLPFKPFYQRFEQDKSEILNINMPEFSHEKPFICILNRQTPNHSEKNMDNDYWRNFLDTYTETPAFMFGTDVNSPQAQHISAFNMWCAVLANTNCKCVISTASGGVYPIFFTGHSNSKLLLIDNNKLIAMHSKSQSFYNPCINFTGVSKKVVEYIPATTQLIDIVTEWINETGV